jgi:membrane-associated phospholipid phosphatase
MKARALAVTAAIAVSSGNAEAQQEPTVTWNANWRRVHWLEAANVAALTVGSILVHGTPVAEEARWDGPILFDRPARNALKLTTADGQRRAALVSDFLYRSGVVAPYVIDNFVTVLGVHQNADVALQMTIINMQSLGLSGVVTLGVEHAVGRARPYVQDCDPKTGFDKIGYNNCGGVDDFQSFWSGHSAAVATMAGLTCVHHQKLPLYGGGVPDELACAFMVTVMAASGVLRVLSDRHWASDVMLGNAFGFANGYVLPQIMHYGFRRAPPAFPTSVNTALGTIVPVPQIYERGAGIAVAVF